MHIIGIIPNSCAKGPTFHQQRWLGWSLGDLSSWMTKRRVVFVLLFVYQNRVFSHWTHLKTLELWRWKVCVYTWSKDRDQLIIFPKSATSFRSDRWYPPVSISWVPTLESTSSLNTIVPYWLGLIGTRARWIVKKYCVLDNNKLQVAKEFPWELIVFSWTRSFTVRVTKGLQ